MAEKEASEQELEMTAMETTLGSYSGGSRLIAKQAGANGGSSAVVFYVTRTKFNADGSEISVPSPDECKNVTLGDPAKKSTIAGAGSNTSAAPLTPVSSYPEGEGPPTGFAGSGNSTDGRRRLYWGDRESTYNLWKAAEGSYKSESPGGWNTWKRCESGSSYAKFMYKYSGNHRVMVVGFAGTDGFSDIGDWIDNANGFVPKHIGNGLKVHQGFYDNLNRVQQVQTCIVDDRLGTPHPLAHRKAPILLAIFQTRNLLAHDLLLPSLPTPSTHKHSVFVMVLQSWTPG